MPEAGAFFDANMLTMSAILYPQKHPISAEEYLRMGEAGVFAPEARLELIEGEIVEMAPIGSPHAGAVTRLNELLVQRTVGRALVSPQNPIIISDRSVPQPDLALLKPRAAYYRQSHPKATDVFSSSRSRIPRVPSISEPRCRSTRAAGSPKSGSST